MQTTNLLKQNTLIDQNIKSCRFIECQQDGRQCDTRTPAYNFKANRAVTPPAARSRSRETATSAAPLDLVVVVVVVVVVVN